MSQIQSYLFYKPDWNKSDIKKFLLKNNIIGMGYLDITNNYKRYRIFVPPKNQKYRTITINEKPFLKAVIIL